MIFYHGSQFRFDVFDLDQGGRHEGASNGALGIWISDRQDIASSFGGKDGGYVYHLEIDPLMEMEFPIRTLVDWHKNSQESKDAFGFYENIRHEAISRGYNMISIVEKDGSKPTRVVLDPSVIRIVEIEDLRREIACDFEPIF